jgi:hypothetical protein
MMIATRDACSLATVARKALCRTVVNAVAGGALSQTETARWFGVLRVAVNGRVKSRRDGGALALKARSQGRPERLAAPHQAAMIVWLVLGRCPDLMKLPFALRTPGSSSASGWFECRGVRSASVGAERRAGSISGLDSVGVYAHS